MSDVKVIEVLHDRECEMAEPMNEELRLVVESDMARWVRDRIETLPEKARYRAHNAVRCLYWAGGIATLEDTKYRDGERGYRVPATFMLTHALEEAVAAVVVCAKETGYGRVAKKVNIKDHYQKTTLTWLCAELVDMVKESRPALAFDPEGQRIVLRVEPRGETIHQVASLDLIKWLAPDGTKLKSMTDEVLKRHGGEAEVVRLVKDRGDLRNKLIYASDTGFRAGSPDLEFDLSELAKTSMGLLWAAVDISEHNGKRAQIVEVILRTTIELKKLAFPPAEKCPTETE